LLLLPLWLVLLLPLWLELCFFASAPGRPSPVVLSFTAHHLWSFVEGELLQERGRRAWAIPSGFGVAGLLAGRSAFLEDPVQMLVCDVA